MPGQASTFVENNFAKGLITEASPLGFPPNACTATYDCEHPITGSVNRRLGWDYEINHSVKAIDRTEKVVVSYLWKDVAGDGNTSLVVLQVGDHLYFYDGSTTEPLSGHPITSNVDLTVFSPVGALSPSTQECQFASGRGKLFVTHPYLEPFAVAYAIDTQIFTTTQIDIEIRDFEGIADTTPKDTRPTVGMGGVTIAHNYNLLNQGWTTTNLAVWDAGRTDLPSDCDVMWRFKNSTDVFDLATVDNVVGGNSPAPKGHFVLKAFDQDRSTPTGLAISNVTSGYQRSSTIAFFSGRLFFAGINYTKYNSQIFFSQVIERDEQFGKCFQTNDPTSEFEFDLLATDGGVIEIQEAGTVLKLLPVPGGLIIFASNGIWMVTGSTGLGFTASDYTIAKVSAITSLSHSSFVDLAGTPVWWNLEGIYKLEASQQGFQVTSLTYPAIKTFYDTIPPSEKRNVRGYFNPIKGVVQWLYKSTESGSLTEFYEYDHILNLNIVTGGFYIWTIPAHTRKIHGMVVLENRGGAVALENVTDNSLVNVTANDASVVQVWSINDSIVIPTYKYITSYDSTGYKFTFAETRRDEYLDWVEDGTNLDYTSYFTTGYKIAGSTIRDFQSNYVTFYSDNTSKFNVQGLWDFSNTSNTKRWSNSQTIDATGDTEYDVIKHRRKIRGRGKVVQVKASSVTGQPFDIKGWGVMVTVNATP